MPEPAPLDLPAYWRRIGFEGPADPTLTTLAALVACHARSIPFENIDVLARRVPSLDIDDLQAKLVMRRRGGYCYEQNTLFMAVLLAMGFRVRAMEARVRSRVPAGVVTGRSHMALRVTMEGIDHLVDVGFGGQAPLAPLRLHDPEPQAAPGSVYRWVGMDGERLLQLQGAQDWSDCYSVIDQDLQAPDREIGNWYAATYPGFALALNLVLGRATDDARLILWNLQLTVRSHAGGQARESTLGGVAEVADVMADAFGLVLTRSEVDTAYAVAARASERLSH
jgi:N-hydroxyarylamine O-acetyltransferase